MSDVEQPSLFGLPSYRIEAHDSTSDEWRAMATGSAEIRRLWADRPTLAAAIDKCLAWAGVGNGVCIPVMRVIETTENVEVWRSQAYVDQTEPNQQPKGTP